MANLLGRSVAELSAAAWFGGSLMGALGLNGAASKAKDPEERTRLTTIGWKRWAPVQNAAVGLYLTASLSELLDNKTRLVVQHGVGRISAYKSVVMIAGAGVTIATAVIGNRYGKLVEEDARKGQPAEGATEPSRGTSDALATAQRQLRVLQWVQALFGGWLIVVDAKQGEMQRPANVVKGVARRVARR